MLPIKEPNAIIASLSEKFIAAKDIITIIIKNASIL